MKRNRILRVMTIVMTALTLSAPSIAYGTDSSTTPIPNPQSTIPDYRYVLKNIVVGSTRHTGLGVVPVGGNHFYLNEVDLAYVLSLYQISLVPVGIAPGSFPALQYQIHDPYIGTLKHVHPFQSAEPVPAYGHLAKVDINGVYVGSVAVVSDHAIFANHNVANASSNNIAVLDNISAQDLLSVFKLINVNSTLTTDAWKFPSLPSGIPQSTGPSTAILYAGGGWQSSLFPISIAAHQVFHPISFSRPRDRYFLGMAITPDAGLALVTDGQFVYPVNLLTRQPESPIEIDAGSGLGASQDIAITPDGKMAYFTNINSITPIDLSTLKRGPAIPVGGPPRQIVISPDGKMAYVIVGSSAAPTDLNQNTIVPIDLTKNTVKPAVGTVPPPGPPLHGCTCVAVDGKLYILTGTQLIQFDPATGKTLASIDVGNGYRGPIALAPDGKTIYLVNYVGSIMAVELATKSIAWKLPVLKLLHLNSMYRLLLQIAPDGKTAYLTGQQGSGVYVASVDLVNHKVLSSTVPVDDNRLLLAMAPDQPPTAAFTSSRGDGKTVMFDASGSKSDMPIAKYIWNFGDGTTLVSSVPKVKHVYANSGTYTVTVIETDTAGASVNNPVQYNGHMVMVNAGSASAQTSQSLTV